VKRFWVLSGSFKSEGLQLGSFSLGSIPISSSRMGLMGHSHTHAALEWDRMGCAVCCNAMLCFYVYSLCIKIADDDDDNALMLPVSATYCELTHNSNLYWSLIDSIA